MSRPVGVRAPVLRAGFLLITLCAAFSYGVGVGIYHWPPYPILVRTKQVISPPAQRSPDNGEQQLLELAFTDPLIPGEQIHPPTDSLDGIHQANRRMFLPVDAFFNAYDNIDIVNAETILLDEGASTVLQVEYTLAGNNYSAYAYARPATVPDGNGAALIIPGSGHNQSSAIYAGDPSNYHFGVRDALGNALDQYVLIKPNEDCLAIHHGKAKLNANFFISWLLNNGASYSAHYLANGLAVAKYLRTRHHVITVAGLSQGGAASLLVSIQSHPTNAIVASGFSITKEEVDWSDPRSQLIIPGWKSRLGLADIRATLASGPTRYLFTWGRQEIGLYKMEADRGQTADYFSQVPNITSRIHEGGHEFPIGIMQEFLRETQGRRYNP